MQPNTQKLHTLDGLRRRMRVALGIKRTYATIWRWATRGIPSTRGSLVKLKTVKVGGVLHATEESLLEFFRKTS